MNGWSMRRVIAFALLSAGLAGCSSTSLPSWDSMKPAAPTIPIRVESEPSGAQATASTGQSCRAPCEMAVPADANNLTITFSLDKFQPQSIPVQRIELPGDNIDGIEGPRKAGFDPNPVIALLEPAKPPAKRARPLKRTAPATAAPRQSAPAPAGGSPFPPPPAR